MVLPDGIAHGENTPAKKGVVAKYLYNLINPIDTEIVVIDKKGTTKLYASVCSMEDISKT